MKNKKECNCPHLKLIRDYNGNVIKVECVECGKTWRWNPLLKYWSDSFVGTFAQEKPK